jgi:hypothetical protein
MHGRLEFSEFSEESTKTQVKGAEDMTRLEFVHDSCPPLLFLSTY